MGINARGILGELGKISAMLPEEGIKVCLGSPVSIIYDARAVCALMQRCPDVAGLISNNFGEVDPLIDECLLLLRGRLKDIDQCNEVVLW